MQSNQGRLNYADMEQWGTNVITFLAPLGALYFGQVTGTLSMTGHVFTPVDLLPTAATFGAMVLFIMNALYDLSRKWAAGPKS